MKPIDLRSDTVTRPTPGMRAGLVNRAGRLCYESFLSNEWPKTWKMC